MTIFEFDIANDSELDSEGGFEERNRKRIADMNTEEAIEEARVGAV